MKKRYAVAAFVLTAALELGARVWVQAHPFPDSLAYRRAHPAVYQRSAYWSQAFMDEQAQASAGDDYHGAYYNITHGMRDTPGQPARYAYTVWMFGSSTMVSFEVPDAYTIPAYVQSILNASRVRARVVNMGRNGATASQQLELLKQTQVRVGDVVVFYDGAAEMLGMWTTYQNRRRNASLLCAERSAFQLVNVICNRIEYSAPDEMKDITALDGILSDTVQRYERALSAAQQWTKVHGARFYHFLQPQVFSRSLTSTEQAAVALFLPDKMSDVVALSWPHLQVAAQAVPSLDLTHILDSTRSDAQVIYFDWDHVNERGNAVIAEALAGYIVGF